MGPFDRITGFDWDDGNKQKNIKHGVTPAEAEQVFLNEPTIITPDVSHSGKERRYRALGKSNAGRQLTVIFTLRNNDTLFRVISARDMHRKERTIYEQEA
ncbi:MAG TPA: BrnT family toxin [Dongiaceae bacterium]|nr:BrnT family toxin [Dongiaceae bacterium]